MALQYFDEVQKLLAQVATAEEDNVLAVAKTSNTPMPVAASVQQTMRLASAQGLAEAELSAIVSVILPEKLAQFRRQAQGEL